MVRMRRLTKALVRALGITLSLTTLALAQTSPSDIPLGDAAIELLSGAKLNGRITAVTEDRLTIVTKVGSREITRPYPTDRIHAVTIDGNRYVLNEAATESSAGRRPRRSSSSAAFGGAAKRSKAEIDRSIDSIGRTPPDWYDSVELEYPRSLDLNWPKPPPEGWNNQKNVGQYIWDVINPNPGKWKSGIRFMHFMLEKHANNTVLRTRTMESLGRMYFDFFRDYPRAAFWLRAAGAERNPSPKGVRLAECYWRMGNADMAKELLGKLPLYHHTIKLWSDMGEIDRALQIAGAFHQSGYSEMAYLSAGDACRTAGKLNDAIDYYSHVLTLPASGRMGKRIRRNRHIVAAVGSHRGQRRVHGRTCSDRHHCKHPPASS